MSYWQVAAGAEDRDYSRRFLQYGMAFVGNRYANTIERIKAGDVIALKDGRSRIVAAGKAIERDGKVTGVGDKEWLRDFDGWDLPAYCHVEWQVPAMPVKTLGLNMGTISQMLQPEPQRVADRILDDETTYSVSSEPRATRAILDGEILDFLVREGLRPATAEDLTSTFNRIRLLANYYYKETYEYENLQRGDVREHETRTFLIVPLLMALGWEEQQVKIELGIKGKQKRVDIACFSNAYQRNKDGEPNNEDCTLILESKDFASGLDYAPDQARAYAKHFRSCQVLIVSNGYCYKAYTRDSSKEFSEEPSAYLNLLRPRAEYPLDPDNVSGALEVLRLMLPHSWR